MTKMGNGQFILASLLAVLALSGCGEDTQKSSNSEEEVGSVVQEASATVQEDYYLSVSVELQDAQSLAIVLASNLPGDVEVMISVGLLGQGPDDLAVGTNQRASLRKGHGKEVLHISEIPQGDYEVYATFYPRWGFGDNEKVASIKDSIRSDIHVVAITGSGEPASQYLKREEGRMWVIDNIFPGTLWEPEKIRSRFGDWVSFPATKRNPEIIKNYYFPSIDMTIVVNQLKGEVATWAKGRQGL
ncbi:hypothetical protein ACQ0MK_08745 [Thalassospira lucentensis]|uniref:hypothetical protein n=1 Tax=Thalassospira lucentensis TaxID=168935 RepID=UPI003D2F45D7